MKNSIFILILLVFSKFSIAQKLCPDTQLVINLAIENTDTTIICEIDTLADSPSNVLITLCNFSKDSIFIERIRGNGQIYTFNMDNLLIPPNSDHKGVYKLFLHGGVFREI